MDYRVKQWLLDRPLRVGLDIHSRAGYIRGVYIRSVATWAGQAFHQAGSSGPRREVLEGMCLILKKWRENSVELNRKEGSREKRQKHDPPINTISFLFSLLFSSRDYIIFLHKYYFSTYFILPYFKLDFELCID